MELISSIGTAIAGAIAAVAAHFVAHDLYEGAPKYAKRLLDHAVTVLPEQDRERYSEEWLAHLCECKGVIGKFRHSVECVLIARKLRQIVEERTVGDPHAIEFTVSSKGRQAVKVTMDIVTALPMLGILDEVNRLDKSVNLETFALSQEIKELLAHPEVNRDRLLDIKTAFERALKSGQPGLKVNVLDSFGRAMTRPEMDQWLTEHED